MEKIYTIDEIKDRLKTSYKKAVSYHKINEFVEFFDHAREIGRAHV